jgi:hypothetical protein
MLEKEIATVSPALQSEGTQDIPITEPQLWVSSQGYGYESWMLNDSGIDVVGVVVVPTQ